MGFPASDVIYAGADAFQLKGFLFFCAQGLRWYLFGMADAGSLDFPAHPSDCTMLFRAASGSMASIIMTIMSFLVGVRAHENRKADLILVKTT